MTNRREPWKAEVVTENLLRKAWESGMRYVKEPNGRMLALTIGNHPDGETAYRLVEAVTGNEVDRVRAKALWAQTREQAEAFDWIGTTPEGELHHMETDGKETDEMENERRTRTRTTQSKNRTGHVNTKRSKSLWRCR